MVVEQVAGVEHVEEVELGVHRDRRLFPGCVRSGPLLYHHLLPKYKRSIILLYVLVYRVDDVVEELVSEGEQGDAGEEGHGGGQEHEGAPPWSPQAPAW